MKRQARQRKTARRIARYIRDFRGPWPDYDHGAYVRGLPCLLRGHGCWGAIQACHTEPRARHPGEENWRRIVPFCAGHHGYFDVGLANDAERFLEHHGTDPVEVARQLAEGAERINGG